MTTATTVSSAASSPSASRSRFAFAAATLTVMTAACGIAGSAPIGFSIATVFLFAGPHNWFEARYFLSKMPARWGKLRVYFVTGIGGVLGLTAGPIGMGAALRWSNAGAFGWRLGVTIWNTVLVVWIVGLVLLRSRQNPRRPNWDFAAPIGLALIAFTWLWPFAWSMALVYLHPLVALLFLDRELGKRNRDWQIVYRRCLLLAPVMLVVLWKRLANSPDLPGDDLLTMQITHHAGASVFQGVSSHLLVSTHTFLEMLHYAVWVAAVPLLTLKTAPWRLDNVPLAKRSAVWRTIVVGLLAFGACVALALWGGFMVDYAWTRDVYFTIALLHVLAEVPFLLRLL